ncbi:hypothetical protein KSP40_PGU010239 [Platanthera guangdongensis]|uniref:Uncharacterized protein n=1 Tax=Platanthera guangdongensis TaxID=2320717 RepID=A0ABR2LGM9_9ASPA
MLPSRPAAAISAASSASHPRPLVQFVRHTSSLSPHFLSRWILPRPSRLSLSPKPSFSSSSLYATPLSTAPAGYPTVDEQSEAAKLAQLQVSTKPVQKKKKKQSVCIPVQFFLTGNPCNCSSSRGRGFGRTSSDNGAAPGEDLARCLATIPPFLASSGSKLHSMSHDALFSAVAATSPQPRRSSAMAAHGGYCISVSPIRFELVGEDEQVAAAVAVVWEFWHSDFQLGGAVIFRLIAEFSPEFRQQTLRRELPNGNLVALQQHLYQSSGPLAIFVYQKDFEERLMSLPRCGIDRKITTLYGAIRVGLDPLKVEILNTRGEWEDASAKEGRSSTMSRGGPRKNEVFFTKVVEGEGCGVRWDNQVLMRRMLSWIDPNGSSWASRWAMSVASTTVLREPDIAWVEGMHNEDGGDWRQW